MAHYAELTMPPPTLVDDSRRAAGWSSLRPTARRWRPCSSIAGLCSRAAARRPNAMDLAPMNQTPDAAHLLGTDFVGRDLLSRIMVGTQAFFLPGLLAIGVSLVFGGTFGALAGFWPRRCRDPSAC